MARRHETGKDHFDLLPFIAILMCVIGCLLLVTMSISALSIGPGLGEGWVPVRDRDMAQKKPVLIEWDGTTATIHREGGRKETFKWTKPTGFLLSDGTFTNFGSALGGDNPEMQKFLTELSGQRSTHYALFAVRPSGFATFQRFADEFRGRQIDVGYEPIMQEKAVRLFKEKTEK